MPLQTPVSWIAFAGRKRVAAGDPRTVASAVKQLSDADPQASIAILDACSSETVEIDLRGPGRPRLGVVAREVTLLPRHWDWLAAQPGGASVALRKLVERAQRASADSDQRRAATESAYRFMHALAGDEAGFEEASRALFAGDLAQLQSHASRWPRDIRLHLLALAERAVPSAAADAPPAAQ